MSISLAKIPERMLAQAAAWTLAATLAALAGCGADDGGHDRPPPPKPVGLTYDVIPLSLGGAGTKGVVGPRGITANGKVGGTIDVKDGSLHAFLYDGSKIVDLGTMGGVLSETGGLNELGQVVGWVRFKDDTSRAFLYDGAMHDLGTLGGADSFARAINERGQATGVSTGTDGIQRAFLFQDGVMKPLHPPGIPSEGRLINAGGAVAGLFDDPNKFTRSFFGGACQCLKDLGTLGGDQSFVFALNDAGQLAGAAEDLSRHLHAFLYDDGAMKDLGTLGGDVSQAYSMNESGWVTGFALTKAGDSHAFVFDGKMMRDLGTLGGSSSGGAAINASGQVVGSSLTAKGDQHAVTWTAADGLVDLNKVLRDPPHGLVVIRGLAISDNGAIVAQANPGLVLLKPHYGGK